MWSEMNRGIFINKGENMPALSIIVPIYNSEPYLKKCFDSILAQIYTDFELVLVDDGSTDGSLSICREYEKKDPRIVVCHKENEGLVAARKTGVAMAVGEYVGFVDSDDFIDVNMYSDLMNEAKAKESDIVIGGIILDYPDHSVKDFNRLPAGYYDKNAVKEKIIPEILMKNEIYKFGIIPGVVVKVFKKDIIQQSLKNVSNELTLGEDVAITSFSVMNAKSISIIESAAYHYIQTETSMIRGYNPKRFDALCALYECIEKITEPEYKKQIGAYFACLLFGVLADCIRNDKFSKKDAKKKMREYLKNDLSVRAMKVADVSNWGFSDKIKFMMMKHKMIGMLTFIFARD